MPLFLFVKYIELIFKKDNILVKIHKNTSLYKNNISTKINDNKNRGYTKIKKSVSNISMQILSMMNDNNYRGKKLHSGNLTFSDFKLLCT